MRLGVIWEPQKVNSIYRALFPLRALQERGHEIVWPPGEDLSASMRDLLRCDLVHCFRSFVKYDDLDRLSRNGVAISFDNDDDFSASDMSTIDKTVRRGLRGRLDNQAAARAIAKAVRLADLATTPSAVLADKYEALGARHVAVIENHLERDMAGFGYRAKHDGLVVGWVAGNEHVTDLAALPIADTLTRLLERHPDLRVRSVGLRLPMRSERYEHDEGVVHSELLRATGAIDIGIAPIEDTPFNRARSTIKLKEYASGGAAWLASPVGPYRGLGEHEGGQLVPDDGWFEALDRLVSSGRRRRRLARRALRWAKTQTIDRLAHVWEQEFEAAIERAAARSGVPVPAR